MRDRDSCRVYAAEQSDLAVSARRRCWTGAEGAELQRGRRGLLGRLAVLAGIFCSLMSASGAAWAQAPRVDPLPSWSEGKAKQVLLQFVEATTRDGAPGFVKPEERIATFDNDGTLWSEQPLYFQLAFALARVKALAPSHPEWKTKEPFKTVLAGDVPAALAQGKDAVLEIMAATHAGMTTDEFEKLVAAWAATAKHPKTGRLYTEMVFQPMLELLALLRSRQFKTFIVSGGGIDFMRPWVEKAYGIPPEQVVGSSGATRLETRPTGPVLVKLAQVEFIDDGPGKAAGIHRFIGRRPVFAFGNSDGDLQMLEWTAAGPGPRLMGLVRHTDAAREWAYDRKSHVGKLDKALDVAQGKGWLVVDMKNDWKRVFPFDP
jgi:phosphoglycolate phosphatase-like HAD superfamily hydrolase